MELGSGITTFVFVALCCLSAALGFEVTLIRSSCTQSLPYFRELESEGTECYRLFHGATQGAPGLTVDKYGPQLLLQTFREKPDREEIDRIAAAVMQAWAQEDKTLPPLDTVIWRHRGKQVETFVLELGRERELSTDVVGKELGLRYDLSFQLQRRDPLLYLDFRVVRRWLRSQDLAGQSVLNLFAYTCGASVAALAAGAARVASVDFSETALAVGRRNVALNSLPADRCEWVCADALPALRQYAGLPVGGRRGGGGGRGRGRGGRRPPFARVPGGGRAGQFDLVVLDPPTWATSAFGAVDIRRDYPALFKPAVLAARPGGRVLATNHLAAVGAEEWVQVLERCAAKAGRPLRSVTMMEPEADFPSPDGRHPLKIALCEV